MTPAHLVMLRHAEAIAWEYANEAINEELGLAEINLRCAVAVAIQKQYHDVYALTYLRLAEAAAVAVPQIVGIEHEPKDTSVLPSRLKVEAVLEGQDDFYQG